MQYIPLLSLLYLDDVVTSMLQDKSLPMLLAKQKNGVLDDNHVFQVLENKVIAITRFDLAFTDLDTADRDLVYHITRPLSSADGIVEHIERPFVMVLEFTQEDINENRILYRPPKKDIGISQKTVTFMFTCKFPRIFVGTLCSHNENVISSCSFVTAITDDAILQNWATRSLTFLKHDFKRHRSVKKNFF